mmetsp:Transcript_21931/g.51277  ORF Transcript_21931/g.51277 Transcript_21931/m.51277 type:complete len:268 (-) Transcript_21931:53-856(-)
MRGEGGAVRLPALLLLGLVAYLGLAPPTLSCGSEAFVGSGRLLPQRSQRVVQPDQRGDASTVRRRAAGSEPKIVYNYFKQGYDLVYEKETSPVDVLVGQLADVFPWSAAEQEALRIFEADRPNWRRAFLGPNTENEFRRSFRAVAEVSGSETQALEIIKRNIAVLLFSENQIRSAGLALIKVLGEAKAREVMLKNPGSLTIDASNLQEPPRVRLVALVADVIDVILSNTNIFGPLAGVLQAGVTLAIGKALLDVVFLSVLKQQPPWS